MIWQLKAPLKLLSLMKRLTSNYGLFKAMVAGLPIDRDGEPVPWLTYPATEFLARLELTSSQIFEYGAGHSTLFWAKRAARIVSVEHDIAWYRTLSQSIPSNVTLIHAAEEDSYTESILETDDLYDIIVIDGVWREACIDPALARLAPSGILVLDNSDWYPDICLQLRNTGLVEISFAGIGPVNRITWVTSVFLRGSNSFQRGMRPPTSCFGVPMRTPDEKPFSIA